MKIIAHEYPKSIPSNPLSGAGLLRPEGITMDKNIGAQLIALRKIQRSLHAFLIIENPTCYTPSPDANWFDNFNVGNEQ